MNISVLIIVGVPALIATVICVYIMNLNKMPGTPTQANRYVSSDLELTKKTDSFSHQSVQRINKNN